MYKIGKFKFEIEGISEEMMPFNLSKIIIVSTAEGNEIEGKNKWNFVINQNNDIYMYFDKNENYWGDEKIIKSVTILQRGICFDA